MVSEAQKWRDAVLVACTDAVNELFEAGHDPHTIESVTVNDASILWVEFRDGSAVFAQFQTDHTGLTDSEAG